jgi:hypothetical protein
MYLWIILLSLFTLVGCSTTPKPEPEIRYKTVVVAPADNLLVDCNIKAPPLPEDYPGTETWTKKEGVLVDLNEANMKNIIDCNVRLKALREWKIKQLEIYKDKTP